MDAAKLGHDARAHGASRQWNTGRPLLRLLAWVLGTAVIAVLGLSLARQLESLEQLRASNDVVGNYLQTIGSIYAVLLAFVVYAVWQQFNEARAQLDREAGEIAELALIARALPASACENLQRYLHDYVCLVLEREWSAMAERNGRFPKATVPVLDCIWQELTSLEPVSERDKIVMGAALNCFNELCNARSGRLTKSQLRMPRPLRLLLYIGAFIVTVSTYLFAVDSFAIHAFVTGATSAAISHVLYVIEDLDDCLWGDWQIPRATLERVRDDLPGCSDRALPSAST